MRQKISELLEEIKKLEKASSIAAGKSSGAATDVSGGLTASYSAAGDAEHSRNSANLSIQKAKQNALLLEEVTIAESIEAPVTVKPVSFVKVDFGKAGKKDLYMVENPVFLSSFSLISPSSPIGEAILGKRVEDLFLYKAGDQTVTGKILEIG
jgi:transcription elongation GreA/GreB family factor